MTTLSKLPMPHRAILVNVIPKTADKKKELRNFSELTHLVQTYGGIVVVRVLQKRGRPSAKTFLGSGKAEEVAQLAQEKNADLVIVNDFLKANQANNLRGIFNCPVWDRFELILKIFEKHARSQEAKLQVELTRLKYEFPKLFGKGAALSQQAGHLGVRGGAGEKLLDVERQHLRQQLVRIEKKLKSIRKVQAGQRARRKRQNLPMLALVGYTNSGKTSLLRALTQKKNLYIANKLFATLENRIGQLWLPKSQKTVLLADTIGFIRDLPPLLFQSFLATLEEVQNADLLLHIIDLSDLKPLPKIKIVQEIIKELGCKSTPQIFVFNKIDLLPTTKRQPKTLLHRFARFTPVFISAENKTDLPQLTEKIEERLKKR